MSTASGVLAVLVDLERRFRLPHQARRLISERSSDSSEKHCQCSDSQSSRRHDQSHRAIHSILDRATIVHEEEDRNRVQTHGHEIEETVADEDADLADKSTIDNLAFLRYSDISMIFDIGSLYSFCVY